MEQEFDEDGVRRALRRLPHEARLSFALSCAERLCPNYAVFHSEVGWGDPRPLRAALDLAWAAAAGAVPTPVSLKHSRSLVEQVCPDTIGFDSLYVSPALDAAAVVLHVLDFVQSRDPKNVVQIAALCRDSVDMYVQEIDALHPQDPNLEKRISEHPLMQRELERQRTDLTRAAELSQGRAILEELQQDWRLPKRSNLDLP